MQNQMERNTKNKTGLLRHCKPLSSIHRKNLRDFPKAKALALMQRRQPKGKAPSLKSKARKLPALVREILAKRVSGLAGGGGGLMRRIIAFSALYRIAGGTCVL